MKSSSKSLHRLQVATLLSLLVICLAAAPAYGIVNGTLVTDGEQQQKGLVIITLGSATCSGVLLVNDWVLTAGHCGDQDRLSPGNIQVSLLGTAIGADAVYLFGGFSDEVGPDLALLHLSAPFNIGGSTTGFRNPIWGGAPRDLHGKTVAIYGQGRTDCAGPRMGVGTYRAADFTIDNSDYVAATRPNDPTTPPAATNFSVQEGGFYFQVSRTALGQITRPGDSGGPGFIFEGGRPMLVGITSGGSCSNPSSGRGYQNSLPRVRKWIEDVFKSKWTPGAQSQPVYVYPSEVAGTGWNLADVNNVHWAQAARAAAAMCFNRGFAGGHFDGHQGVLPPVSGNGFGLQCSGGDTLWLDVTTAQMDAQWRFSGDINNVNWAQAGRAAERICAARGYAGGQFNGHQRGGNYGLFCYRGGAQWFDATDSEVAATGWGFPTPRLDDNLWAQAARAAVGFCRNKGFSGGFMNGHQAPGRFGIVCQGDARTTRGPVRGSRVVPPGGSAPSTLSKCQAAELARARNSPAAEGLTAQCLDTVNELAARGEEIANQDPLAAALRNQQPDAAARRGFDIGMAAAEGQTADGPGKKSTHDSLPPGEQAGFSTAVSFSIARNKNLKLAMTGARIAEDDRIVARARNAEADPFYKLGFDIATGIFGDPAQGALGNTATGPGSLGIRNALNDAAQRGFNAAVTLHLSRNYLR